MTILKAIKIKPKVTMVTEISLEEAKAFYNMDNMARFPIFGKYKQ